LLETDRRPSVALRLPFGLGFCSGGRNLEKQLHGVVADTHQLLRVFVLARSGIAKEAGDSEDGEWSFHGEAA
jgi:hypothetical protein